MRILDKALSWGSPLLSLFFKNFPVANTNGVDGLASVFNTVLSHLAPSRSK